MVNSDKLKSMVGMEFHIGVVTGERKNICSNCWSEKYEK